jgi:2-oxo-hept-3-ene-1,7-dioate hydratase
MKWIVSASFAMFSAAAGWAGCASDEEIAAFVASYTANEPAKALGAAGSMADALCTQGRLAAALEPHMGPVIGYKAGLTAKPAQERFGVSEPVQGVLYQKMMLEDGAGVQMPWGAVPMVEADLVFVVADAGINAAATPAEVLAHVSAIRPFIELPDLTLAKGEPITGVTLTAMGVGPKLGVLGAPVAVEDPVEMASALAGMTVTLTDADGKTLVSVPGKAILGNPVNSVLWLMSKGVELQEGDLISAGSFGPLFPPQKTGGGVSARYDGLPGNPVVSVSFLTGS